MSKSKVSLVEEVSYGVYVWQTTDGRVVADEDGNFLSIFAMKNDPKRLRELRDAAKSYGIEGGQPLWLPGHRKITDEEYEEQKTRAKLGLVPDTMDVPAIASERLIK